MKTFLSTIVLSLLIGISSMSQEPKIDIVRLSNRYETNVSSISLVKYVNGKFVTTKTFTTNVTEFRRHRLAISGMKTNTFYTLYTVEVGNTNIISKQPIKTNSTNAFMLGGTYNVSSTSGGDIYFLKKGGNDILPY